MKKYLLPLFALLLFTNQSKAQLTANAGADFSICLGPSTYIGGNPAATGGTQPYAYQWYIQGNPTQTQSNPLISTAILGEGVHTYTLVVTDNTGATASDAVNVTVLPVPVVNFTPGDTNLCETTWLEYRATVTGTSPFTYSWNMGDGTIITDSVALHVYPAQGSYNIELLVTDANGCVGAKLRNVTISTLAVYISPTNVNCFGGSDGSLQTVVTGGTQPYFYNWSIGSTVPNATNLPAGTYSVTVFDSYGCSAYYISDVLQPAAALAVTAVGTNESTANACDGSVTISITGGNGAPYNFNWSNISNGPGLLNVCAGAYTVTVTDNRNCTATTTAVVGGACGNNTLVVSIASQDLSCTHPTDTLTANVTGGTAPYTFLWTTGSVGPEITVAQAGVYMVYVTDDSGCVKTAIDTLLNNGVVIALQGSTPVSCNGNPDGAISVAVTGGTPPYTYVWNTTPSQTTNSITGLVSGTYALTVTDAALCTATFSYFLNQNSTNYGYYVYASGSTANCGNNGTATVIVYGGTAPFTFLWSNSDTSQTITGLSTGNYSVTITGADGCIRTGYTTVYTSCYNVIEGFLYNDANNNCVKDSGETILAGATIAATNGTNSYYGYTNSSGFYNIRINTSGTFTLQQMANSWGSCSNVSLCNAVPITFAGVGDTTVANIGLSGVVGFDLALHPGWTSANPGFTKQYWVLIYQQSNPVYSGAATIVFKYDPVLQYVSSNNGGVHNATDRTITWQVADASVPVDWTNRPQASLTVPANTPVGYQLTQEFWLLPFSGDCDTSDNYQTYTEPVTGSLDPNEKQVSPAGDILEEDSVLTYTIHFQNTGNDTTAFVILKDTLSTHLNPATIQNLASSHEYTSFDISENGILTWLFNPIFLVDSATNEPASKGFVTFRIKKKNGLPLNTEIKNSASIYFDYNEPIKTNTVSNHLTEPNSIYNVTNDGTIQVTAAPNPFTQQTQLTVEGITGTFNFELFDVSGKLLKRINALADSRFTINRESMSAGVYFYSITTTQKQKAFGRLVVE